MRCELGGVLRLDEHHKGLGTNPVGFHCVGAGLRRHYRLEGSHVGDFRDHPDPVRRRWIDLRAYCYPEGSEELFAFR
jgi:hypothetical protein